MCTGMDEKLADLLLDPDTAPESVKTHVAECDDCHRQLEELRGTMAVLDSVGGSGAESVLHDPVSGAAG